MPDNNKSKKDTRRLLLRTIIPAVLFVLFAWGVTWFSMWDIDLETRGTFGDMFGGLNALFSGLAFAGVIIAIVLQTKELELQRQELEETRAEIRGQKEQLEAQAATMKKQAFETAFFRLLQNLGNIVGVTTLNTPTGNDYSSHHAFEMFFTYVVPDYYAQNTSPENSIEDNARNAFLKINDVVRFPFDPALDMIASLLIIIDSEDSIKKEVYFNLVMSSLTDYEKTMLFYFGVSYGPADVKTIIEKNHLMRDLKIETLINTDDFELYDKNAYKRVEIRNTEVGKQIPTEKS